MLRRGGAPTAEHYHRSPTQITEEDLRQYFLYLANEKQVARATATIAPCGIRFFYTHTLQREWTTLRVMRPRREWKLPVVLSRKEMRQILQALRSPIYRACLTTIYAGGLRLLEGARLQVTQMDSARLQLHIHGKGGQGPLCAARGADVGPVAHALADPPVPDAAANLASAAMRATDGKPRAQGRVRRRSRISTPTRRRARWGAL